MSDLTEGQILAQQLEHLDAEPLKMGDPLASELGVDE
ncbi:hypothetical protein IWX88_000248 [Frigoribacterium sp. CG_9.8]|nr:hypothetical protein [Frigoribacterium sp. CG_9.8]